MLRRRIFQTSGVDFRMFGNLVCWLSARDYSTLTFNGGAVSQINDKSSTGLQFVQGTAINQPTYTASGIGNLPSMTFDGLLTKISAAAPITQVTNITVFAVAKWTNLSTTTRQLFSTGDVGSGFGFTTNGGGTSKREIIFNSVGFETDDAATTNAEIWCMTRANPASALYVNGNSMTLDITNSGIITPVNTSNIGGRGVGASFIGQFSELLYYNNLFTSTQVNTVTRALNDIYHIY